MSAFAFRSSRLARFAGPAVLAALSGFSSLVAQTAAPDVTLLQTNTTFTLQNGLVAATVDKASGALVSLRYKGNEMLGSGDRSNGYWSMPGTHYRFGGRHTTAVLEDPKDHHGDRATISCNFAYDGVSKSVPADVEFRYSLGRGDHAIYLEAVWKHRATYPQLSFPVGRFAAKLNDLLFDWMTVDAARNLEMIKAQDWDHGIQMNMKEARLMTTGLWIGHVEHKYDYSAVQFDTPAYGWSSSQAHVGIWMVNPSFEYMSGGPTKLELTAHRDATFTKSLTAPAAPTLLNVWKGPHYGGTSLVVEQGESWTKVVGPFLLYCNDGPTPDAMWHDALDKAAAEAREWPYRWIADEDYPDDSGRSTVSGRILLKDQQPGANFSNLLVGLTHADYKLPDGSSVDWQRDGKYDQFWVRADASGRFKIPHVLPGSYTLHAFADGVLGEYSRSGIEVVASKPRDLKSIFWTPVRYGRQLWDIGVPDRTSGEFLHGKYYWTWGIYNQYAADFPRGLVYTIGKSDYHRDWNMMQVPHGEGDTGSQRGAPTTWTVVFNLPVQEKGLATLRLAFAGTEAKSLAVGVNGTAVETLTGFINTSAIHRDADRSYWYERDVPFDARLLHAGKNELTLTVPAGPVMSGIEYDYLRLEINPHAAAAKAGPAATQVSETLRGPSRE